MVKTIKSNDLIADILSRISAACAANDEKFTPEIAEAVEKDIRSDWGGDRYFVAKHKNSGDHSERNSRIMRDYLNGERLKLLERRYKLSGRRILQIIRPPK
jgi:Mor family transcriptional regulator